MKLKIDYKQVIVYLGLFIVIPSITYFLGSVIDRALNLPIFPDFPINLFLGISIIILCLNIGVKSHIERYENGGRLPWDGIKKGMEPYSLITSGPFSYSRNPMVLSYSFLPFGMGIIFRSIGMTLSNTPILLLVSIFIIKLREEPYLFERFGPDYTDYCKQTPFLFPNFNHLIHNFIFPFIKEYKNQLVYVILAEFSLAIMTLLIIFSNTIIQTSSPLFRLGFASICFFGIIAGISPSLCSISHGVKNAGISGHHPNCDFFKGHVVNLLGSSYCAGCTGLVVGAIISLFGILGAFNHVLLKVEMFFWIGVLFISLGLAQHFIDLGNGWIHIVLNVGFVSGSWLFFESIYLRKLGYGLQIYYLIMTLFWIWARIRASQWTHVSVCAQCSLKCELVFE